MKEMKATMISLNLNIDDKLKQETRKTVVKLGLDLTTATKVYISA